MATQVETGDQPAAGLASPVPTAGPFKKVGGGFIVDGEKWMGCVVASPECLFLVKHMHYRTVQKANLGPAVGGALGGIVGGAIGGAIAGGRENVPPPGTVATCAYGELPAAVRFHPQWPVAAMARRMKGYDAVRVIVVPRASITSISHKSFSNLMGVKTTAVDRLVIEYFPFTGGAKRRALKELGYPVV